MSQPVKYGLVVFAAIFAVGWITGMGGSPLPNLLFGAALGVLVGGLFWPARRLANNQRD